MKQLYLITAFFCFLNLIARLFIFTTPMGLSIISVGTYALVVGLIQIITNLLISYILFKFHKNIGILSFLLIMIFIGMQFLIPNIDVLLVIAMINYFVIGFGLYKIGKEINIKHLSHTGILFMLSFILQGISLTIGYPYAGYYF